MKGSDLLEMFFFLGRNRQCGHARVCARHRKAHLDATLGQRRAQSIRGTVIVQPLRLHTGTGRVPGQSVFDQTYYGGVAQNGLFSTVYFPDVYRRLLPVSIYRLPPALAMALILRLLRCSTLYKRMFLPATSTSACNRK